MVSESRPFSIRFWGVRGSFPVSSADRIRYGGNTTCFELKTGSETLIIDCGSGAHNLGNHLIAEGVRKATILLSHTHLDHICGLPFFVPAYRPDFETHFYAGHLPEGMRLEDAFEKLMDPILFPVPPSVFQNISCSVFTPGDDLETGLPCTVKTLLLNHPGRAVAYRVELDGRSVSVISDHEHGDKDRDEAIVRFIEGTDLMIFDAMFSDEEYKNYVGWGHSTYEKAIEFAKAGNVKKVIATHHAPHRTDEALDEIRDWMRGEFPNADCAREGATIDI